MNRAAIRELSLYLHKKLHEEFLPVQPFYCVNGNLGEHFSAEELEELLHQWMIKNPKLLDTSWYSDAADKLYHIIDTQTIAAIATELAYGNKEWFIPNHMYWGVWVRNQLRMMGYTDDIYGNIDDHYVDIVELMVARWRDGYYEEYIDY